jgi:hypothetical protein
MLFLSLSLSRSLSLSLSLSPSVSLSFFLCLSVSLSLSLSLPPFLRFSVFLSLSLCLSLSLSYLQYTGKDYSLIDNVSIDPAYLPLSDQQSPDFADIASSSMKILLLFQKWLLAHPVHRHNGSSLSLTLSDLSTGEERGWEARVLGAGYLGSGNLERDSRGGAGERGEREKHVSLPYNSGIISSS